MATSVYIYKKDDTLVKLADRFNTDVDTLVRLNSWLKDINTGKTHIKLADSTTIQILDIANSQTTNFKFSVMPKHGSVTAQCVYIDNSRITFIEDSNGQLVYNSTVLGEIQYDGGTITISLPFNQFKSIKLIYEQDYWPDRIILPIVANGNTSTEDYWNILNDITGIQSKIQIENSNLKSKDTITKSKEIDNIFSSNLDFRMDDYGIALPIQGYTDSQKLDSYDLPINGAPNNTADYVQDALSASIQSQILGITDSNSSIYKLDSYDISKKETKTNQILTCLPAETKMIITVGGNTIYLPIVPESISESSNADYSSQTVLGSSEPYRVFNSTSVRKQSFSGLVIHRDMTRGSKNLFSNKMLEQIAGIIQSGTYPNYDGEIAPLRTTVRVMNQDYISGIMTDSTVEFSGPLMANVNKNNTADWMSGRYAILTISFTIEEVNTTPKGAYEVSHRWTRVDNSGKGNNSGVNIY